MFNNKWEPIAVLTNCIYPTHLYPFSITISKPGNKKDAHLHSSFNISFNAQNAHPVLEKFRQNNRKINL